MTTSTDLIADLVRKHIAGVPLAIHHPVGGRRYLAEIYETDRGFVFADIGWDTNDHSHPLHVVSGEATAGEDGSVVIDIGDEHPEGRTATVYEVRPDLRSEDPAARDAARWRDYLASPEGARYPGRAFPLRFVQELDETARLS
jgi:hypothetical protein